MKMNSTKKFEDFIARLREKPQEGTVDLLKAIILQKVREHEEHARPNGFWWSGFLRPAFALGACCLLAFGVHIFYRTQRVPAPEPAATVSDTAFQSVLQASLDSASLARVNKVLDSFRAESIVQDSINRRIVRMIAIASPPSAIADSAEILLTRFHVSRMKPHNPEELIERRIEAARAATTISPDSLTNTPIAKQPQSVFRPEGPESPEARLREKEEQMQRREEKIERKMEGKHKDRKSKM